MIDVQKYADIGLSAAITAGSRVQELRRNGALESVQVNRQVVTYENGGPSGEPFMRSLTKTNADILSHDTIVTTLRRAFPEAPILSEEEYCKVGDISNDTPYFIVDPIDGTIHLEKNSPQWSINVALCINGNPIVGIVVVPAENRVFLGVKGNPSLLGACDEPSLWDEVPIERRTRGDLIVSKCAPLDLGGKDDPIPSAVMEANGLSRFHISGSAYRYIEIAMGAIDVIVHGAGNFLWDKAAAQVVIEGTGGALIEIPWNSLNEEKDTIIASSLRGTPMQYTRKKLKDDGHIVLSRNAVEELPTLRIPKSLDQRNLWKFVIT